MTRHRIEFVPTADTAPADALEARLAFLDDLDRDAIVRRYSTGWALTVTFASAHEVPALVARATRAARRWAAGDPIVYGVTR